MQITPLPPIQFARTTDPKLRQIFALRPHALLTPIAFAEDQETQIGSLPKPAPLEADDFCCIIPPRKPANGNWTQEQLEVGAMIQLARGPVESVMGEFTNKQKIWDAKFQRHPDLFQMSDVRTTKPAGGHFEGGEYLGRP